MLQNIARNQSRSPYMGTKARRRRKTSKEERVCPVCNQTFKKAEHLARHLRSHTKEKPFNCLVCQKAFARQDTLLRHSRSHSINNAKYGSVECSDELPSGNHTENQNDILVVQAPLEFTKSITANTTVPMSPPDSTSIAHPTSLLSIPETTVFQSETVSSNSLFSPQPSDQHVNLQPPSWEYQLENDWEYLLNSDQFDLNAVSFSLQHTPSIIPPAFEMSDVSDPEYRVTSFDGLTEDRMNLIQRKWHTFIEASPTSDDATPEPSQSSQPSQPDGHINESYRDHLHEWLRPHVQDGSLPPAQFLSFCIVIYFSRFHSLFPIAHAPTLRSGAERSILVLSICSVGSLFAGSGSAISHGISLFERLNKKWEKYLAKSGHISTMALQASILGQTFGLLMGRPKDLLLIDVFHGSLIAWARKKRIFFRGHLDINLINVEGEALEKVWKTWLDIEINMRIVLGLHIHDAELAKLHHHPPLLRQSIDAIPRISSEELFMVTTASGWKALMIESQYKPTSPTQTFLSDHTSEFVLTGMLESISALAVEQSRDVSKCHALLKTWRRQYAPANSPVSWVSLLILWHSIFVQLHVDFDTLELALGREGYEASCKAYPHVHEWIRSPDAKRCLLHVILIQNLFGSLPIGNESAIYIPLCLYHCGIIVAAFWYFTDLRKGMVSIDDAYLHFDEFQLSGVEDSLAQASPETRNWTPNPVFRIIGLLQRIGHWRIARSLATTLLALVDC
ncbi:hypothetical protein MYU51_013185 [Penicillium brevicompactum]